MMDGVWKNVRKATSGILVGTLFLSTFSPLGNTAFAGRPSPSFNAVQTQGVGGTPATAAQLVDGIELTTLPASYTSYDYNWIEFFNFISWDMNDYYFADNASFPGTLNNLQGHENVVRIGATIEETVSNLIHAINKDGCVASWYAAGPNDICLIGSDNGGLSYPTSIFSAAIGSTSTRITLTATSVGAIGNCNSVVTPNNNNGDPNHAIKANYGFAVWGADEVPATQQIVTFTPVSISPGTFVLRMAINGELYSYKTSSGATVKDAVEALNAKITATPPSWVGCSEDDIKITCAGNSAGVAFTYSSAILDESALQDAINAEYNDGDARSSLKLSAANYTPASWATYSGALADAIAVENNIASVNQANVDTAVSTLATAKSGLVLDVVTGTFKTPDTAFISSLSGSISLENLTSSGEYALYSGGNMVSSGTLVAQGSTGSVSILPGYFTDFWLYTLTLSGTHNSSAISNLDTANYYIGPVDYETVFDGISANLSASGITTNLGQVTYGNVNAFAGLYFDITHAGQSVGRITFPMALNLSDSSTVAFLQEIGSHMSADRGYISFDPATNQVFNTGATIAMYFTWANTPNFNGNALDYVVARDSSGALSQSALVGSNIACSAGTCTFTSNHFASFDLKPYIATVSVGIVNASNSGTYSLGATASENLQSATVTFSQSGASNVVKHISAGEISGKTFSANANIDLSGFSDGSIGYAITPTDVNGNIGIGYAGVIQKNTTTSTLSVVTPIPTFTKDTTPDITISSSASGTLSSSGACSASGQVGVGNTTVTLGALADGTYNNCSFIVTDWDGNASAPLQIPSFTVDTIAPTGYITSQSTGSLLRGTVNITATGSDIGGSGIAKVEFYYYSIGTKIGEVTSAPYSLNWNTVGIVGGDGNHHLVARITDKAGNTFVSESIPVLVDNVPPTVTTLGTGAVDYTLPLISPNLYGTTLVFNEELSSAGKIAAENALTAGIDVPLTFQWGTWAQANELQLSYSGASVVPFPNDVEANVSDLAGNSAVLLLIDSKLTDSQATPDGSGSTSITDNSTPQIVITNPVQPVVATIGTGVSNPSIDVGAFIYSGAGLLPQITIDASTADVQIPASTTVTSADSNWSWVIAAPTVTTVTLPTTSGVTRTLDTALEMGFSGAKLSFDKAVRVVLKGKAGKRAGWSRTGVAFTEITSVCSADTQAVGDALGVDGDCKMNVGSDLVIWTKHFTIFAAYTETSNSTSSSGGGGGSIILKDVCPNGDYSSSYYDRTCGNAPSGSSTIGSTTQSGSKSTTVTATGGTQASDVTKKDEVVILFTDIATNWAKSYIENLAIRKIVDNTTKYRPNDSLTRAEFIKMVIKSAGYQISTEDVSNIQFTDVSASSEFAPYISVALKKGIISDSQGTFRPNDAISRGEAVKILIGVLGVKTITAQGPFTDVTAESGLSEYIETARMLGIISGQTLRGKLIFRPDESISRAEVAKIIVNAFGL